MRLGRQDPRGWGRGGVRIRAGETLRKGLGAGGVSGQGGGRGGEGKRCGGRREGAHWQVAVVAQAHLGRRWEGARGLAQAHPRGKREKPGSMRSRSVAGFASSPLPYPRAAPATTPGPAPILYANGQRRLKIEIQKPFRLEIGSPIGSGESRGWRGRWSSELPKSGTLGRGFRCSQSAHRICRGRQRAEPVD